MTAGKSWAPIRGKRMRLTRLTAAAAPDTTGLAAMVVSKGFVTAKLTPQYDEGQKVQQKTSNGDYCINEPATKIVEGVVTEIQFCGVDPDIYSLITGQPVVLDGQGQAVGFRLAGGVPVTDGFALEVWTGVAGNSAQGDISGNGWGYFLVPYLYGGKVGELLIQDGAATFTVTTESRENPGWGTGPYDVVDTSATGSPLEPGPLLTPIGPKDHVHLQYTTITPPAVTAGLVTLAA